MSSGKINTTWQSMSLDICWLRSQATRSVRYCDGAGWPAQAGLCSRFLMRCCPVCCKDVIGSAYDIGMFCFTVSVQPPKEPVSYLSVPVHALCAHMCCSEEEKESWVLPPFIPLAALFLACSCKLQIELQKPRSKLMEGKKTKLPAIFSYSNDVLFPIRHFPCHSFPIHKDDGWSTAGVAVTLLGNVIYLVSSPTCICEHIKCVCLHLFTQR